MISQKTVLIVTSSYAPAMMADMHRARLLAWELPAHGWNVEVLAPGDWYQFANSLDSDSEEFFCPETVIHHAPAPGAILRRVIRSSTIGWRALLPLDRTAGQLFKARKFDLVYFSTTQFNLFLLGTRWRRRYGVPYVLDVQDPIYRPRPPHPNSGQERIKTSVNRLILAKIESRAASAASAVVSVSTRYLETLRARYADRVPGWLPPNRHAVIPFAASDRDLGEARSRLSTDETRGSDTRRIVYVGVGGVVMARAFEAFCRTFRRVAEFGELADAKFRIELYGTMFTWEKGDSKDLSEIAAKSGIAKFVFEDPRRISYRKSLEILLGADGALILGVDQDGYMPSKLYTYALSEKPLLGVLRNPSEGHDAFVRVPELGHVLTYGDGTELLEENRAALKGFLRQVADGKRMDRIDAIKDCLAPAMARRHAELFNACVAGA